MPVTSGQAATVVHDNELPVPVLPTYERHAAAGAGNHRSPKRRFNILPGMKLISWTTEWIPASAKSTFERALNGPKRRCVAALPQDRFIGPHIFLKPAHLGRERRKAHLVERQCGTTRPGETLIFRHHARLLSQLSRSVFYF